MSNLIDSMRPLKGACNDPTGGMLSGMTFGPQKLVQLFSAEDWVSFSEEWASSLESKYLKVWRFDGPGDMGCDVVGFTSEKYFDGEWDNYQCKRYGHPLTPGDIWVELAKIIYYSFIGEYSRPRKCYFAANKDIGLSLKKLFTKPHQLKKQLAENWAKHCSTHITETKCIPLEGPLQEYFDTFDFTIFTGIPVVEMIKGHASTVFYFRRFGTIGFPERPAPTSPPNELQPNESRYVQQLLDAYSDHLKTPVTNRSQLAQWPELEKHFRRSREVFYHAESLRSFAQDSAAPGTFEQVKDEIHCGVVDACEMHHEDGLERVRATIKQAATLTPTCNALCLRVQTQDKQGICHHLANDDRLTWVDDNNV